MSEALKIRWGGLVRPDDPEYLAAMSAQALAHRRIGPRQDPGEIYRASSVAGAAVRLGLGPPPPRRGGAAPPGARPRRRTGADGAGAEGGSGRGGGPAGRGAGMRWGD